MIRSIAKRMYTQVCTKNIEMVYPAYNELNMDTPGGKDDGYRILVDVCHYTKTIL